MLAVTAGAFLVVTWVATRGLFFLVQESPGYEQLSLVSGTAALALAGVPALTSLIAGLTAALAPT